MMYGASVATKLVAIGLMTGFLAHAAIAAEDSLKTAVAQLQRADLGEVDQAFAALEKAASGAAGNSVIDALAPLLADTTRVPLTNTADLIWPGAKESFGHGRVLPYDVDSLAIRAGWVIETITFRDFGFGGNSIDVDGSRAKAAAAKFHAAWPEIGGSTWTRYAALKSALSSKVASEQLAALDYLRFGKVGCTGLDVAAYERDLQPLVKELEKSDSHEVHDQAELLLKDGSEVVGNSNRKSWTSMKIEAGFTFSFPSTWTSVPVKSSMRQAQFQLPTVKNGDGASEAPELVVYYFGPNGGGGVAQNYERWRGQFQPNEGKTAIEDKPGKKTVNGLVIDTLECAGRFVAETAPGSGERVNKPNFRMLAAIVPSKQGLVYFKLVGPSDAVNAERAGFEQLLESLLDSLTTTDADLAAHLSLEFGAEADAMYAGEVSFGLRTEANEHLSFVGRRIVVECNGKVIPTPFWSGALRDSIGSESRQVRYWHMHNFEVVSWLGGPGEYELRASIGPVFSNKIRITLPGPVIQSPTIDHIAR